MSVSINGHPHNMGDDDGPLAADHYKRAVLRPAPSRFAIEFHEPCKVGGSSTYSFGMRVSPITTGDRASLSSLNVSEYDVWRRWEDCLWFQDNLELEYERSARQKRQRLIQGKGVKKRGFYLQDKASSFESLPPGPDPESIKQNIHDYIPKLTKRGTIFRASAATIAQRDAELQAFVEALFKEDQPALIRDMRSTRLVTDFFGIWHRDAELASKKRKASVRESHGSITPSVFSSYFSASSTPSLSESLSSSPSLKPSLIKRPFLRQRSSTSAERPHSVVSSQNTERPSRERAGSIGSSLTSSIRRRPTSTASSDSSLSSSSSSSERSDSCTISDISRVTEEVPISLEACPEEYDDVVPPLKKQEYSKSLRSNMTQKIGLDRRNRNAQIFISPPKISPSKEDSQAPKQPVEDPGRSMRESWASIDSTSTYLEGLNIGFTSSSTGYRQSMASIKTFMTTDSTEAVIPRTAAACEPHAPPSMNGGGSVRPSPRASIPVSLSDFDMYPEIAEDDDMDAIYDAFPRPATFIPERPETPVAKVHFPSVSRTTAPPSPTTSVSTMHSSSTEFSASTMSSATTASTTSSGDSDTLSLKVSLNNLIVMLRVSRDSTYTELRQRIFNKFIGQEGIPLSKEFKITVVVAHTNSLMAHLRKPGNSMLGTPGEELDLRLVECQGDWETITYATEGHKFSLRIFDNPI